MYRFCIALLLLASCSTSTSATSPGDKKGRAKGVAAKGEVEANASAYFAGGCFWGVEHFLEKLPGVSEVESGYMGGSLEKPSYEDVVRGKSGHLEAVHVRYDNRKISYKALAKRFFEIHDPTQVDGQGPDLGEQYLSAVFYSSEEERELTLGLIERLEARGYKVATKLHKAVKFWPAEDYHQDYYVKSGKAPYCHGPVDRFGD